MNENKEIDPRLMEALTEMLNVRISQSLLKDIEGYMNTMQRDKSDTARILLQSACGWPLPKALLGRKVEVQL